MVEEDTFVLHECQGSDKYRVGEELFRMSDNSDAGMSG